MKEDRLGRIHPKLFKELRKILPSDGIIETGSGLKSSEGFYYDPKSGYLVSYDNPNGDSKVSNEATRKNREIPSKSSRFSNGDPSVWKDFSISKIKEGSSLYLENPIIKYIYRIHQEYKSIYDISPREFEEVIAELLRGQGYNTKLTKQSKDGGYDLVLTQ